MNDQKKSGSGLGILVLVLAYFGINGLPQGGGLRPQAPPTANQGNPPERGTATAGAPTADEDVGDDDDLGPLKPLRDWRGPIALTSAPSAVGAGKKENARDRILTQEHGLQFLIVLVPNPRNTSMSHEFDPTLSSVLRATESAGLVAERFASMPGFEHAGVDSNKGTKDVELQIVDSKSAAGASAASKEKVYVRMGPRHERTRVPSPGSVLCVSNAGTIDKVERTKMLLLLVPETPTWGVDQERLTAAIKLVAEYWGKHRRCKDSTGCVPESEPIRIVGPNYSGSISSMARLLRRHTETSSPKSDKPRFVVYNGAATSIDTTAWNQVENEDQILFRSTVYSSAALQQALETYAVTNANDLARLVESNTAFGVRQNSQLHKTTIHKDMNQCDTYSFPFGIARIREEYSAKGYLRPNEPVHLASPERLSPLDDAGKKISLDTIPISTPFESTVDAEMGLSQMLFELERQAYEQIEIMSTSTYDRLFLVNKVRQSCPDARFLFSDSAELYAHHAIVPYLRGSLVASTYPLDLASQGWTASPADGEDGRYRRVGFPYSFTEGVYNATVAQLAEMKLVAIPKLLDYSFPGESENTGIPPIWISVVGERGLYPLKVLRAGKGESQSLYRYSELHDPKVSEARELKYFDNPPRIDVTWYFTFLTAMVAGLLLSSCYLFLTVWPKGLSARTRAKLEHPVARILAPVVASAAVGQLVVLSTPAWRMESPSWLSELRLLAYVTIFTGSAAVLVALLLQVRALIATNAPAPQRPKFFSHQFMINVLAQFATIAQLFVSVKFLLDVLQLDSANARLYAERASRLVNGVSPIVPMLLIGLAGGVVVLGDWRRIRVLVRLGGVNDNTSGAKQSTLPEMRDVKKSIENSLKTVENPLTEGCLQAGPWLLVAVGFTVVWLALASRRELPQAIEPGHWYWWMFTIAFTSTLGLLGMRLVGLIGAWKAFTGLLEALARVPLAHAFDRLPAPIATTIAPLSAPDLDCSTNSDPLVDKQFQSVVNDLVRLDRKRPQVQRASTILWVYVNECEVFRDLDHLPLKQWWNAVHMFHHILAPYWASRGAIGIDPALAKETGQDSADWHGLDNDQDAAADFKRWLIAVEDLVALILVRQLAWLRSAVTSIFGFLVIGLVAMTLVLNSYPFLPKGPLLALVAALTAVTVGVVALIAYQTGSNEVLSRLNKTPHDRFTIDREFLTTMITLVAPLLGLLAAFSYGLSDLLRVWLEPLFR